MSIEEEKNLTAIWFDSFVEDLLRYFKNIKRKIRILMRKMGDLDISIDEGTQANVYKDANIRMGHVLASYQQNVLKKLCSLEGN